MHVIEPILSVTTILSISLAFAEAYNNNWRGIALGSTCALLGIVALI